MTRFTLEPVWADKPDRTQRIMLDALVVGHLYSPDDTSPAWELWPRDGCQGFFEGFGVYQQHRDFGSRSEAEAYLGIRQSVQEAA
jgi:hypothetical protein